jgi:hypothetical protein
MIMMGSESLYERLNKNARHFFGLSSMLWELHHGTTEVATKLESLLARLGIDAPVVHILRSSAYIESVIPFSVAVGRMCQRKDSI